ncbi:MAG: PilZ domain-containing protein [Dehalococcoidia bacterium]
MQVVLCDTCHQPLGGRTTEMHLFFGEAFSTHDGRARVAHRGTSKVFNLCQGCGSWLEGALKHLRASHDRRTSPRIPVALEVEGIVLDRAGLASTFHARTINLSQGGAALSTNVDIPAGTEVMLRFLVVDKSFELRAVALPRIAPSGDPPLRVRFTANDDRALDCLDQVLRAAASASRAA